jgi:hypothetical protein
MTFQEEEQSRLRRQSSKQAIALAMQGQWREAIAVNRSLVKMFPNDVDAYNRLGRAYMEIGEYAQAEEAYRRAVQIDPYNTIATRNLERLSHVKETGVSSEGDFQKLEPHHFIEEVGKAGVVQLYRLAPPEVLAKMVAGDQVNLRIGGLNLVAENSRGEYLGQVEPRHGQRLARLMDGGNRYSAAIVSLSDTMVTIIIREVYQDPRQAGRISFPPRGPIGIRTSVSDRAIRRELEYEDSLLGEPGYTVIGGDEPESFHDDSLDSDDEASEEE